LPFNLQMPAKQTRSQAENERKKERKKEKGGRK
jgi:hypothetical protein